MNDAEMSLCNCDNTLRGTLGSAGDEGSQIYHIYIITKSTVMCSAKIVRIIVDLLGHDCELSYCDGHRILEFCVG